MAGTWRKQLRKPTQATGPSQQAHGRVRSGCPSGHGMVGISLGNAGWGGARREQLEAALLLELSMPMGPVYLSCTVSTACGLEEVPAGQVLCVCEQPEANRAGKQPVFANREPGTSLAKPCKSQTSCSSGQGNCILTPSPSFHHN